MIHIDCYEDLAPGELEANDSRPARIVLANTDGRNVFLKVVSRGGSITLSLLISPDSADEVSGSLATMASIVRYHAEKAKAEKK